MQKSLGRPLVASGGLKLANPEQQDSATIGTQTLVRGLSIIDAIARGARDLKEISQAVGITRSTTHRLISSLVSQQYLRLIPGEGYLLGPKLIEMGMLALQQIPLTALAQPYLQSLGQLTSDTIHLGIREGAEVLYLQKIQNTKGLDMRSRVGQRMPLSRTGIGKALILDLPETELTALYEEGLGLPPPMPPQLAKKHTLAGFLDVMRRYSKGGYSFDLEENEPTIRCVAAPIRDAQHRIVAAISVASTSTYMPMQRMRSLISTVQEAAAGISRELGNFTQNAKEE